jgi:alkaline phosphatase
LEIINYLHKHFMKKVLNLFTILLIIITLTAAGSDRKKPRNLILFIGDGMGVAQVYAAMTSSGFTMAFPAFPVTGFSITYSANSYTTDSAAGATAMATGEKTNNRFISMRPDSTILRTLFELAKETGKSTGIVCTSSVTDATPASFVTHVPSRSDYRSIAEQYAKGAADIFIGGGVNYFSGVNDSIDKKGGTHDITMRLSEGGYDVVYSLQEFKKSGSKRIAGLISPADMPFITAGRDPHYLADATAKAIEVLSENPKGFILLVEGSQIDDAGHNNDAKAVIDEVLDLDRAVTVALGYANRANNTLIVVTADHETGGMSIRGGDVTRKEVASTFSSTGHSGIMVPVFAYGPGSGSFSGVQQNTELFSDFVRLLSLDKK